MSFKLSAVFACLGSLILAAPGSGQAPHQTPRTIDLPSLSRSAGAQVRATIAPGSGTVSFLRTTPGAPIPAHGATAEERARRFLDQQAGLFGFRSADELETLRVSAVDVVGMEHVRFRQTYRGIPVAGGEIGVHLRGDGVVAVHSRALADLSGVPTTPTVGADAARVRANTALFLGLILPHGLLELTAVFVAAAIGLRLFWSWVEPGERTRLDSFAREGRTAAAVALGLVAVLLVSGFIEGFVTPSGLPTWSRIGIGIVVESLFLAYVFVVGRSAVRDGATGDVLARDAGDTAPVSAA